MVYRRNALSCALKNKMFSVSTRRKGAVWKLSALLSGLRRRSSSRHTRKRRALSKVSVQRCARRRRRCCRNRSSWRRTLPGQCTNPHCKELSFTHIFVPPLTHLNRAPTYLLYCIPHASFPLILLNLCSFVSGSSLSQNAELNSSIKALEISQQELEKRLEALQLQHQQDSAMLQTQLDEADSRSKTLQREVYSPTKRH